MSAPAGPPQGGAANHTERASPRTIIPPFLGKWDGGKVLQ